MNANALADITYNLKEIADDVNYVALDTPHTNQGVQYIKEARAALQLAISELDEQIELGPKGGQ